MELKLVVFPMVHLNPLEEQIIDLLDQICNRESTRGITDREWTSIIKRELCSLGDLYDYETCAAACDKADFPEWLFDITWLDGIPGRITRVPLVVESEWSPGGVEGDFQKLLLVRAELRMMLYRVRSRDEQRMRDILVDHIEKFRESRVGDRYLLAQWNENEFKFDCTCHMVMFHGQWYLETIGFDEFVEFVVKEEVGRRDLINFVLKLIDRAEPSSPRYVEVLRSLVSFLEDEVRPEAMSDDRFSELLPLAQYLVNRNDLNPVVWHRARRLIARQLGD